MKTLDDVIDDLWEHDPEFGEHVPRLRTELATLRAKAAAWDDVLSVSHWNRFHPSKAIDAAYSIEQIVLRFREDHPHA